MNKLFSRQFFSSLAQAIWPPENTSTVAAGEQPIRRLSPFIPMSAQLVREGNQAGAVIQQRHPFLKCALLVCKPVDAEDVRELSRFCKTVAADLTNTADQRRIAEANAAALFEASRSLCFFNRFESERLTLPQVARPNGNSGTPFHSGDIHND